MISFIIVIIIITNIHCIQEVAQAQKQLELLANERECRQEEERLTAELQGLEKNLSYKELDLKATLDKQQKYDAEVSV